MRAAVLPLLTVLLCVGVCAQTLPHSRDLLAVGPTDRAKAAVHPEQHVVLHGNVHPLARAEFERGAAPGGQSMDRMILVFKRDARQQVALDALLEAQQDPASPYYHRWLTAEEFGQHFGISDNDLARVGRWLAGYGLVVEEVPAGRTTLIFSGTAAQVEAAFGTPIRSYRTNGQAHYANAKDPEIPRALAEVVHGVVSLHDFRSAPAHVAVSDFTASNGATFLTPQDWATIYDVVPLYGQGLDGTGQSIAVLGRVEVSLQDVRTFRSNSALPPNDPQIIVNGPDPGFPDCVDEAESSLDVEWAGAIAKNASIKFVTSKSGATDGINLSAQYAVTNQVAPIVSLSYGLCEAALGSSGNAFWNGLWAQAAAEGMSVLVSAGDSGAAGCDNPDLRTATLGQGVNGICSTPSTTCVGGTQFNDRTRRASIGRRRMVPGCLQHSVTFRKSPGTRADGAGACGPAEAVRAHCMPSPPGSLRRACRPTGSGTFRTFRWRVRFTMPT